MSSHGVSNTTPARGRAAGTQPVHVPWPWPALAEAGKQLGRALTVDPRGLPPGCGISITCALFIDHCKGQQRHCMCTQTSQTWFQHQRPFQTHNTLQNKTQLKCYRIDNASSACICHSQYCTSMSPKLCAVNAAPNKKGGTSRPHASAGNRKAMKARPRRDAKSRGKEAPEELQSKEKTRTRTNVNDKKT